MNMNKEKGRNRNSVKVNSSAWPISSHSMKTSRPYICYYFRVMDIAILAQVQI